MSPRWNSGINLGSSATGPWFAARQPGLTSHCHVDCLIHTHASSAPTCTIILPNPSSVRIVRIWRIGRRTIYPLCCHSTALQRRLSLLIARFRFSVCANRFSTRGSRELTSLGKFTPDKSVIRLLSSLPVFLDTRELPSIQRALMLGHRGTALEMVAQQAKSLGRLCS